MHETQSHSTQWTDSITWKLYNTLCVEIKYNKVRLCRYVHQCLPFPRIVSKKCIYPHCTVAPNYHDCANCEDLAFPLSHKSFIWLHSSTGHPFPRCIICSTQADLTVHYGPIMQYEPGVTAFWWAFYGPRVARPVALAAKLTAEAFHGPSFLFSHTYIRTCYWPSADHGRLQWTAAMARPRQRCNWRWRSE